MKIATLPLLLLAGTLAFATGTLRVEQADGSFVETESDQVVQDGTITHYLHGESQANIPHPYGWIIKRYRKDGTLKWMQTCLHGITKFREYDEKEHLIESKGN
jgi:hypothetical protein